MTEKDLRCPGCSGFNKAVSTDCIFKGMEEKEDKDYITCSNCGYPIPKAKIARNPKDTDHIVCPKCGRKEKL